MVDARARRFTIDMERAVTCVLCGGPADVGPAHVVVHGVGDVCWVCSRVRDADDWGMDQFEAILARIVAARDQERPEAPDVDESHHEHPLKRRVQG